MFLPGKIRKLYASEQLYAANFHQFKLVLADSPSFSVNLEQNMKEFSFALYAIAIG